MPFESWTDYLLAVLWLIPVWAGAFAWGYKIAERWGWREVKASNDQLRQIHERHIAAIEAKYGISADILHNVWINQPETEH